MKKGQRNQEKRERIIQQGITLLTEHGYHGTGLKEILDAVQVPKGSFYTYFKSKEQFVAEVIQEFSASLMAQMDNYIEENLGDPVSTIRGMYHQAIAAMEKQNCRKGCLLGDLSAEIGGQSQVCQEAMQQAYGEWQKRMVPLFEQGQDNGALRSDLSGEQLAEFFWNQWEGALLRMKIEGSSEGVKRSIDRVLDTLFKA